MEQWEWSISKITNIFTFSYNVIGLDKELNSEIWIIKNIDLNSIKIIK